MDCAAYKPRGRWELAFAAQPEEVAVARRLVRAHLGGWGLPELVDAAELCVSELVSNVVTHVGHGAPVSLVVSEVGGRLRIEVRDPDTRALPTLVNAGDDAEVGRGMALVDALTECWGIRMEPDGKVTWCELAGPFPANEHGQRACVTKATPLLSCYGNDQLVSSPQRSRLAAVVTEAAVIDVIAALLHWLRAHGHDADEVLDRAQTRFEAQFTVAGDSP
ncbi:ATP-binding protein [Streptomyces sp. DH24]|uniref:ATP-binding protein n=1 Tax=Streptomyces sp. DH24 TaxID=3040123 RepID=UPI00244345CE|nr:ATP-binding protein [Streptomyces sp. DH24]MDG9720396.1 ATP-binding protein [Streptomyces sp. DH24]